MRSRTSFPPRWRYFLAMLALISTRATPAVAYTPESPEVQRLLERAAAYLEDEPRMGTAVGGRLLVALALTKVGRDQQHPFVQDAIEQALEFVERVRKDGMGGHIYNEAVCLYFLCEMNPTRYREEIEFLLDAMVQRQRPNGTWGYNPHSYDDTSQTQYGVLSLWAAQHHGFAVPGEAVERAVNWLMRVQDPSGGWPYRARDPGDFNRVNQHQVTHSMSAAGLSSVYICAHLLGLTATRQRPEPEENGLPPAVKRVPSEEEKRRQAAAIRPNDTNVQQLQRTQQSGNDWFEENLKYDVDSWTHYYMYAVERYKSFREFVEGRAVAEPDWYIEGVEYLRKTQNEDGSWISPRSPGSTPPVDTSFAILFLTRSSRSVLRQGVPDEGTLIGGRGLPRNLANARLVDGQVVTPQMIRDVDDLLNLVASTADHDFDATRLPGGLTLDEDLTRRTSQLERLRQMVSDPDYQRRLAAVKTLGRSRDLDNVPALIYALSDPDPRVVREARDGLRRISRRFRGFGLPANPTTQQVDAAVQRWKHWYRSIRPDGAFIE